MFAAVSHLKATGSFRPTLLGYSAGWSRSFLKRRTVLGQASRARLGGLKTIHIDRCGDLDVLVRRDLPVPTPGLDEVLIWLARSGINFADSHTGQPSIPRCYPSRRQPTPAFSTLAEALRYRE